MIVPQVLVSFTMELVAAAFGDHIDGRDAAPKLGVHVGGFDPHFLDACRRLQLRGLLIDRALHVRAVDRYVRSTVAIAASENARGNKSASSTYIIERLL